MMKLEFLSKASRLTNYSTIPNELFSMKLSSTATILYAKLLNRANLSISNGKVDDQGRIYILYRQEDLARELGKSISTIKGNMNELVEAGLIEKRRADKGRANMIYVLVPGSSLTDQKVSLHESDNKPYKSQKAASSWVRNPAPNNSNNNRDNNLKYKYTYEEGESF